MLERQSDSHGVQSIQVSNANVSAINQQRQKQPQKQQQHQQQQPQLQHMNFPHLSFPTYGDPMVNMAVYNLQIRTGKQKHFFAYFWSSNTNFYAQVLVINLMFLVKLTNFDIVPFWPIV